MGKIHKGTEGLFRADKGGIRQLYLEQNEPRYMKGSRSEVQRAIAKMCRRQKNVGQFLPAHFKNNFLK